MNGTHQSNCVQGRVKIAKLKLIGRSFEVTYNKGLVKLFSLFPPISKLKDYRDCKCCLYISIKFLVQDRVQDKVQDKVRLRKFSPKIFFLQKALKCHV